MLTIAVRYPLRLIPTSEFKKISDTKSIQTHYLGKWVEGANLFKDEDGKLSPAAIEVKRIPGFSTNKILHSKKCDLNIQFIKEVSGIFNAGWEEGQAGLFPSLLDFQIDSTRKHYFVKISDIDGYTDKYHNPPGKTDDEFMFTVKVVHKPLMANYWHFELSIDTAHGKIESAKSAWQKVICSSIRDRIQEKAIFKI